MFHSVTINGKNTWDDYHMIPANGIYLPPPPEQKRTTIDLKTGNGLLDVSTVLTGYPLFQNRSGELQYFILDPWDLDNYIPSTNISVSQLEARVRKHYTGSNVDNIFNRINEFFGTYQGYYSIIMVALGEDERDTAITVCYTVSTGNKFYKVNTNGRVSNRDGNNNTDRLYKFCSKSGQSIYNETSRATTVYDNALFSFDTVNLSQPWSERNEVLPSIRNFESNEYQLYCSQNVYTSSSSSNILYKKTLYKDVVPPPVHTMPDPYDVYSQLLADIHGKSGRMIFEDDPYWYYQGNFTVRSMETNAIRRAVSIGYEVAPYKIKTSSITQTTTSVNSSSWTTFTYSADDIGSMPVHPKVRVTSLPSGGSLSVKFTSPASGGTAITKTITATGDHTWADVIVYNNTLSISYLGSADSGYNVTHIITPGRL
ncbi:MAG: hypothetical protein J6U54_07795 [Clostridiales bacterium]|nr:hypothetical protein [Clostridiales bacterium]